MSRLNPIIIKQYYESVPIINTDYKDLCNSFYDKDPPSANLLITYQLDLCINTDTNEMEESPVLVAIHGEIYIIGRTYKFIPICRGDDLDGYEVVPDDMEYIDCSDFNIELNCDIDIYNFQNLDGVKIDVDNGVMIL